MNTTLHIPINKDIKVQAEARVKEQGYSSLQEVIRVLVFSLARGEVRTTFIPTDTIQILTPKQEQTLIKREKESRAAIKKGKAHVATSVTDMMKILENTSHNHE
jgi:hypothetical protein